MAKCIFPLTALLLLAGCAGKGDGYQPVGDPPDQNVAFASDAVQTSGDQHAEFASAALTEDCAQGCTGACASVCREACSYCPSAVSCVGRIGAGDSCDVGALTCVAEHCPELLQNQDVAQSLGDLGSQR
jgi:hypothetical protein